MLKKAIMFLVDWLAFPTFVMSLIGILYLLFEYPVQTIVSIISVILMFLTIYYVKVVRE